MLILYHVTMFPRPSSVFTMCVLILETEKCQEYILTGFSETA